MRCQRCGFIFPEYLNRCPVCGFQNLQSHLVFSIMCVVFCFFPTGLMALYFASTAEEAIRIKDFYRAKEASRNAQIFCLISLGIGVIIWLIIIFMVLLALLVNSRSLLGII